jgi:hypothetical protein
MTELIVQGDEDPAETAARREAWQALNRYAELRRNAYADIGDQLDMQFHDLLDDTTTWRDHVATVKAAHPKPD